MSDRTDRATGSTTGTAITCQQVVALVTDYLEDELDVATRAELETHLALCPGCGAYLDQMRRTIDELGHVPVDTLSEQAQTELLAAFRTLRPRGSRND